MSPQKTGEHTIKPQMLSLSGVQKSYGTREQKHKFGSELASIQTDLSGFIINWSISAEQMYGFNYDEIISKHISELYCEGDLKHGRAAHELHTTFLNGGYKTCGWQRRKNGQLFWTYTECVKTETRFLISVMEVPTKTVLA